MFEETNNEIVHEQVETAQQPEQDAPVDEVQQQQPEQQTVKAQDKEANIKELRLKAQRAEQAERERDELRRKLLEVEVERLKQTNQGSPQAPVEEEELNLGPDDFAEGKHLNRVGRKIKRLEDQLKQYQQQSHESIVEAKLRSQYNDFDKVVSADNIQALARTYPEIAQTLQSSNADLYSKAVSAYSMIKKLGIYTEDVFENERAVAQKNAHKPRPSVSISPQQGESPLHRANAFANGLTDDLKAQLRKEMEEARKGY